MKPTLYEALGLSQAAAESEIKAALRRLVRRYYTKTRAGHADVEEALRFLNHASHRALLLDALFSGEPDGWGAATDKQIFAALVEAAGASGLRGDALRQLNIVVALLVCLRAGVELHPSELPNVGTPN